MRGLWSSGVLAAIVLAGCTSSSPPPTGVVAGRFVAKGGFRDDGGFVLSGTMKLHNTRGHTAAVGHAAKGKFQFRAKPGSYSLSGRSPMFNGGRTECLATDDTTGAVAKVIVKSEKRVVARVVCFMH
jgi:hypothetical protein